VGYTHYYEKTNGGSTLPQESGYYAACSLVLAGPDGETGEPVVTSERVSFNGTGWTDDRQELGHESMTIHRSDARAADWGFCKTERKPYDLIVCAVLIAFKQEFGSGVAVDSDGGSADWKPALEFYEAVVERKAPLDGPWRDNA